MTSHEAFAAVAFLDTWIASTVSEATQISINEVCTYGMNFNETESIELPLRKIASALDAVAAGRSIGFIRLEVPSHLDGWSVVSGGRHVCLRIMGPFFDWEGNAIMRCDVQVFIRPLEAEVVQEESRSGVHPVAADPEAKH